MADSITFLVDDAALLAAIDRFPVTVAAALKPVARATATRIREEAYRRFARARAGPTSS